MPLMLITEAPVVPCADYVLGASAVNQSSPATFAFTKAVAAGEFLSVAVFDGYGYDATLTGVSDSQGNTYELDTAVNEADGDGSIYVARSNITTALTPLVDTLTLEFSDGPWSAFRVVATKFTNVTGVDTVGTPVGFEGAGSLTASVTPASDGALLIAYAAWQQHDGSVVVANDSSGSYTNFLDQDDSTNICLAGWFQQETAAPVDYTTDCTANPNDDYAAAVVIAYTTSGTVTGPPAGTGPPVLVNPGDQTSTYDAPITPFTPTASGAGPLAWTATNLPAGITLNSSTGELSGTPTASPTADTQITVMDTNMCTSEVEFAWEVVIYDSYTDDFADDHFTDDTYTVVNPTALVWAPGSASLSSPVDRQPCATMWAYPGGAMPGRWLTATISATIASKSGGECLVLGYLADPISNGDTEPGFGQGYLNAPNGVLLQAALFTNEGAGPYGATFFDDEVGYFKFGGFDGLTPGGGDTVALVLDRLAETWALTVNGIVEATGAATTDILNLLTDGAYPTVGLQGNAFTGDFTFELSSWGYEYEVAP